MGPHTQTGVQEEDALSGPSGEIARRGHRGARLALHLLEDVAQRGRKIDAFGHREAEPVGLSRPVIGILPQDDHLDAVEGRLAEGVENQRPGRITGTCGIFRLDERDEAVEIGLLKLPLEPLRPTLFYVYPMRHLPVISFGCSRPMMCRMLGATSARTPSTTLASLFSVT